MRGRPGDRPPHRLVSDNAGGDDAPMPIAARLAHVALWTRDVDRLEALRAFYERHFDARAGARYRSARQPGFVSYFLSFADGAQLELMTLPDDAVRADRGSSDEAGPRVGYAHVALSLGSTAAVDALTARLAADGVRVLSPPRWTGDGFYESVIADPDGNPVELTA
jgi:lactoylglutathione lyase